MATTYADGFLLKPFWKRQYDLLFPNLISISGFHILGEPLRRPNLKVFKEKVIGSKRHEIFEYVDSFNWIDLQDYLLPEETNDGDEVVLCEIFQKSWAQHLLNIGLDSTYRVETSISNGANDWICLSIKLNATSRPN
ncbi:MAG: hypothetical protein WA790_20760 [Sulfitobacter sp.]